MSSNQQSYINSLSTIYWIWMAKKRTKIPMLFFRRKLHKFRRSWFSNDLSTNYMSITSFLEPNLEYIWDSTIWFSFLWFRLFSSNLVYQVSGHLLSRLWNPPASHPIYNLPMQLHAIPWLRVLFPVSGAAVQSLSTSSTVAALPSSQPFLLSTATTSTLSPPNLGRLHRLRLAPEHHLPASHHICRAAFQWIARQTGQPWITTDHAYLRRILLAGDGTSGSLRALGSG